MNKVENNSKKNLNALRLGIFLVIVAIFLFSSISIVPAGHTGILVILGKVSETSLTEGLHFKPPIISQVVKMDTRVQKSEVSAASASKDLQAITSTIAVNYRVAGSTATKLYKEVGVGYESILISPAIQESVKAVTAKFTAEQVITERQIVSNQMLDALNEKVNRYGIFIEVYNVTDFQFSEEFNKAIEAKQTAQQQALKAEQDLTRIKIEATQQIEKAKAEAEAYRLKNIEITEKTLAMEYLQKWDGKLPVVSSESNGQILDISSLISNITTQSNQNLDKTEPVIEEGS